MVTPGILKVNHNLAKILFLEKKQAWKNWFSRDLTIADTSFGRARLGQWHNDESI